MKRDFTLAQIFQNNMVFQANKPIYIFGECQPNIAIDIVIYNQTYHFITDSDTFIFKLKPLPIIKNPFDFIIRSENTDICINNCLAGDVYLCTGQSNMQYVGKDVIDTEYQDIKNLRLYEVPKLPYVGAEKEFDWLYNNHPQWYEATKTSEETFSAIAYMVGKDLIKDHDIPIGMVSCNNGDTTIYSWLNKKVIKQNNALKPYLENYNAWQKEFKSFDDYDQYFKKQLPILMEFYGLLDKYRAEGFSSDDVYKKAHEVYPNPYLPMGPKNQNRPGGCYDTMLSKIIPFANNGIIYYQGENDVSRPKEYQGAIQELINSWRHDFKDDLPFINCQIAGYIYNDVESSKVAELRMAQASILDIEKKQYVVSAADKGEANNIHPVKKAEVAKRIYHVINEFIYNKGENSLSPMIDDFDLENDQLIIKTKLNALNLYVIDNNQTGFYGLDTSDHLIAINDISVIGNQIILNNIKAFKEIQYGYESFPVMSLYTENDLPLLPFKIIINKDK